MKHERISDPHHRAKTALSLVRGLSNDFPNDDGLFDAVTFIQAFADRCAAFEVAEADSPIDDDPYKSFRGIAA